jgi:predicted regulator of Ras-like GTPase activity (Roadblock/LC7/MglB family)
MGAAMAKISVKDMLCEFSSQGGFEYAFIADQSGLLMACTASDMVVLETQAAVLARIKNTVAMVDEKKGLGSIEEMVFNVSGKRKLICRNFCINKNQLILAVSMESHLPYKRSTGSFIRQLQNTWDI